MSMQRMLLMCVLSMMLLAPRLSAQETSATSPVLTPALARSEMTGALRWLIAAEEAYWFKHESYTTDLAALRAAVERKPSKGVVLSVHHAGGREWAASAEHRGLPGRSCVIYVGVSMEDFPAPVTRKDKLRPGAGELGMPICDRP